MFRMMVLVFMVLSVADALHLCLNDHALRNDGIFRLDTDYCSVKQTVFHWNC